ncbi:unnamed protein product [Brassicogethes aeneus]|uniref:Uncharacterized protein n=1 Tax=Brassicogethes aeneus TaxID=1431903 RepID=A0A9P0FAJ0_BRAAE|nr:unnamed protein product [Brassicogethes aeneus]
MKWLVVCVLTIVVISLAVADGEIWEEDEHEVLIRSERGAKNRGKPNLEDIFSALELTTYHLQQTITFSPTEILGSIDTGNAFIRSFLKVL